MIPVDKSILYFIAAYKFLWQSIHGYINAGAQYNKPESAELFILAEPKMTPV